MGIFTDPEWSLIMGLNRSFSSEFKAEAVRMVVNSSRPIAEVARELGISNSALHKWLNEYRRENINTTENQPSAADSNSDKKKLKELEKEIRELRMENEFLGKAAAFFAKKHDQ